MLRKLNFFAPAAVLTFLGFSPSSLGADRPSVDDRYVPGPDSVARAGVPKGRVFEFDFSGSKYYPGSRRTVGVYIPAQYSPGSPACVYVSLDGLETHFGGADFNIPVVFDNLIDRHQMPVTIAIGVGAGQAESANPPRNPRYDRSVEFDEVSGNFGNFLLDELLPRVERTTTASEGAIVLSKNPNDRAVGGFSTGGIGAFTLAWEHPDSFRRVFTTIGTFVGMRGGDRYPVLIRKTEPKPIRLFVQDGSADGWPGGPEFGDWWLGNQALVRALEFSGYAVEHVWGEGSHNLRHAVAIFPDAMRWLWQNWPAPVIAGSSENTFLRDVLQPGEPWKVVPGTYRAVRTLASTRRGELMFADATGTSWRVGGAGVTKDLAFIRDPYAALAFGGDGRVYVAAASDRILAYGSDGKAVTVAQGIRAANMVVTHQGALYITEGSDQSREGKVWFVSRDGKKTLLDAELKRPSGIALSPDGRWLVVSEADSHWAYSYRVEAGGMVRDKQRYFWFHVPDEADDSGAVSLSMDRDGRLYAATRMGVQVFDHNGRVRAIIPVPGGAALGLSFGGPDFQTLYVLGADQQIYQRRLKVGGVPPGASPADVPDWGAG
jgi:sugar lactone lactonase YvrE/S-formylglutathione hydrolase FrmB